MYQPLFDDNGNIIGYIGSSTIDGKRIVMNKNFNVIGFYFPDYNVAMDDSTNIIGYGNFDAYSMNKKKW